jgi:multidrug resistance efflux pump
MGFLAKGLRRLEEDLVGTDNRTLFCVWCLAVAVVVCLGFYLNSDSVSILGVADSREFQVNFDSPVAIKQIHVLPGQVVKKGDLLMELNQSDLEMQLYVLKSRFDKLSAELKLRQQISSLAQDVGALPSAADPIRTEWADTKREIALVEERLKHLFVFAEVEGRVGAVNFKVGEKVPSFSPIVTLLPLTPTYVNGFINENLHSQLKIGDWVDVVSVGGAVVRGKVISLGARIVQIPQRLLRIQTLPAWGREIVVQIPEKNALLIGERVSVKRSWSSSFVNFAQADDTALADKNALRGPQPIELPVTISDRFDPEISGMVYIPELSQFVLISDDHPKDHPVLLLMNEQGRVQDHVLEIQGLEKMEDIESISYQNGSLYLLSSLSPTKKGKIKISRQLFVRAERRGMEFHLKQQMNLQQALVAAFAKSSESILRSLASDPSLIETEGHALLERDLYLALKEPLGDSHEILILKIKDFPAMLDSGELLPENLTIARRLSLSLPDKSVDILVTDMMIDDEQIYLASSYRGKEGSAIWRIDESTGAVSLVQEFQRKHLEALAVLPSRCEIFGVFEGKQGNFLTEVPLPSGKKDSRCF